MYDLILRILNMSITATFMALAVILLRLILKNSPKWTSYALWSVVLFRLLCPVSFTSDLSLLGSIGAPAAENGVISYIPENIVHTAAPQVDLILPGLSGTINNTLPQGAEQLVADPLEAPAAIMTCLWLIGVAAMLLYSIISYTLLKRRLSDATLLEGNVFETDAISSPFVCGLIKPRIYLPVALQESERRYVLLHERTHIRRRDYLIKPLAFLALSMHWFNPFMWLSFRLMCRDMEMSCDEHVARDLDLEGRAGYSAALIHLAMKRPILSGSPLAFGESGTKQRVKNVLNYKRPVFWVIAVSAVAVIAAAAVLIANPKALTPEQSLAAQFLKHKTEYVGNNSKVGGIIWLLEFPNNTQYDSFALKTDEKPYEITVNLNTDATSKEEYFAHTDSGRRQQFEYNAAILLSLVGNADIVNFNLQDGKDTKNPMLVYTRTWADNCYGRDIREFAENEEELGKLLNAQAPMQPEQRETTYTLVELGKNGEVLATAPSPFSEEKNAVVSGIVFDFLLKSSGAPGVDLETLDGCYSIQAHYTDNTYKNYYVFMLDGHPYMQDGKHGFYTQIAEEQYKTLVGLMDVKSYENGNYRTVGGGTDYDGVELGIRDLKLDANPTILSVNWHI